MKRLLISTIGLIAISIGFLNAQINQGRILVGVSSTLSSMSSGSSDILRFGYSTTKSKSDTDGSENQDKSVSIYFNPKVGYFVTDNLAIGLDLNVGFSSSKYVEDDDKYSYSMLSVGPFVRYYIPTTKVLPFFELSGSFGTLNSKSDYSDNSYREDKKDKTSIMTFGGGIGLAAPLGERVMVDVLAGYSSFTYKHKEDNEDNERTINGTFGLKVGFIVLLGSN